MNPPTFTTEADEDAYWASFCDDCGGPCTEENGHYRFPWWEASPSHFDTREEERGER